MEKIYSRTKTIQEDKVSGFCPGCMHSTVIKLIGEVLDEMNLVDRAASVLGIGCCGLHMDYIAYDTTTAPHGRACAVATGMKRANPDTLVFTYQGDGDFASIGMAESIHAANRGENITVIFINNGIYGMTGGQMAPTTLIGMKASTAPKGRIAEEHGYPMHMCEILNQLTAPAYLVRTNWVNEDTNAYVELRGKTTNIGNFQVNTTFKTKQAIHKAFQNQLDGKGFSMVEIVTNCPTNWGLDPLDSLKFIEEKMLPEYPLGVIRDR
jgi:2-oxoglutarate ferredoxin oxidoreductase subunit beta